MCEGKEKEGSGFESRERRRRERKSVRECAEKSLRCRHSSEDEFIYKQRELGLGIGIKRLTNEKLRKVAENAGKHVLEKV